MNFIDNISIMNEEITNYYIIVLDTSKYQESSDLYGQTLAYFDKTEQNILDKLKLDLTYKTTNDINKLKDMLFNQEVESILITDIIKNKLEEDYEDFRQNIRILETIEIKNDGNIYIDDKVYNENYISTKTPKGEIDYPHVVEENSFFVIGDNRLDSYDSRYLQIQDISKNKIRGRVVFSISRFKIINRLNY